MTTARKSARMSHLEKRLLWLMQEEGIPTPVYALQEVHHTS